MVHTSDMAFAASNACPVEQSNTPKCVSRVQFGLANADEIQRMSEIQICSRELFQMPYRNPAPHGCLDPRLGVSDKKSICQTCKSTLTECAGHFGHIQLELPVFHIGYFRHTLTVLQVICKSCARVLLPPNLANGYLTKLRRENGTLSKTGIYKKIVEKSKKVGICPYCSVHNGAVKKVAGSHTLKLVHEVYKGRNTEFVQAQRDADLQTAIVKNKEVEPNLDRIQHDLSPLRVHDLFKCITDEDCALLWMDPSIGRPEDLLIRNLLVPPVPIRPSVAMDVGGGSTEDDLTVKLQEIIDVNNALKMALNNGANAKMIMENWDFLQVVVSQYINGEMPGLPRPQGAARPIRGLCQRLKGKSGRFRGNLSGKRVDYSGRTVISPDPNLKISEVGVPVHIAKIMTYPEQVNCYNIKKMQRRVVNGPDVHPGANFIRPGDGNYAKKLAYGNRKLMASMLRIGDTVERHMEDGDIVLFNRQPSLHKMSIMAHRVRVAPWRTFSFNECVCTPYNADFDGDEMNMHLPQTEEARAEAAHLMEVEQNLCTPRNGEPLVAATQDFLTAAFLLTQRNVFFDHEGFCRLAGYLGDAMEEIELPLPAIIKPVKLWTGKQLVSLLVRPNKDVKVSVNTDLCERSYKTNGPLCKDEGYVMFRNSEHVCGSLAKKTLGNGSKSGLLYALMQVAGPKEASRCMNRLAKLSARYLGSHMGFSVGIDDVMPSERLTKLKDMLLTEVYENSNKKIQMYANGELPLKPGCDAIQSLESELNGILGELRQTAGNEAMKELPWANSPRIMAECGSKGSPLNISQMIACVGQQSVGGRRIDNGFIKRTLPHFSLDSLHPKAKGFVANSFFTGLDATEFFFHTMGGREGLVDTAVKTAETGYMARRLMKALEDLSMQYDNTVRNSENTVVQFVYGDDGLNPQKMETSRKKELYGVGTVDVALPADFNEIMSHVMASEPCLDELPLSPEGVMAAGMKILQQPRFAQLLSKDHSKQWWNSAEKFVQDVALDLKKLRSALNIPDNADGFVMTCEDGDSYSNSYLVDGVGTTFELQQRQLNETVESSSREGYSKLCLKTVVTTPSCSNKGSFDYPCHSVNVLNAVQRITSTHLHVILDTALCKYEQSRVEPGEAVGAVGAQSISEPGTQMTLKTFHFAGVASMNVTLGVPRLKEIINASRTISTPIITAKLVQDDNKTSAWMVKATIEKTTLGQVTEYIKEVWTSTQCYISVKLDLDTIDKLHLDLDIHSVVSAILAGKCKDARIPALNLLKPENVCIVERCKDKLKVFPPVPKGTGKYGRTGDTGYHSKAYFILQTLRTSLPNVIVKGVPSVSRAVINIYDSSSPIGGGPSKIDHYHLLVEGYGLASVIGAPGIDGTRTRSNSILEVMNILGVEAARVTITEEISYIMQAYGISIDRRHLWLLADVMTFKGEVLGITRFGVSKMRESVLMLASFEKTCDHLSDAAVHARQDTVVGVSECIIMGVPIPIGTGLFKLHMAHK